MKLASVSVIELILGGGSSAVTFLMWCTALITLCKILTLMLKSGSLDCTWCGGLVVPERCCRGPGCCPRSCRLSSGLFLFRMGKVRTKWRSLTSFP